MKTWRFAAAAAGCLLFLSEPAQATIEVVKGSLSCFLGCNKNVVQSVAQGQEHAFEVVGQFVDTSTGVEITGSGVTVRYGTRKGGSNSSIIVEFIVQPNAALGERTVKMRYFVEANGPDTFKIRVVRRGTISRVQYRRPLPFRPGGGPASTLVEPVNLPLNERVVLVVTGTKLDNVQMRLLNGMRSARVLPGATDGQVAIEVQFSQSGRGQLLLYDAALSAQELISGSAHQFSYERATNQEIQFGSPPSGDAAGIAPRPPLVGGGGASTTFVDVAPRANMLNVFRRQNPNPAFTENGAPYFSIDSERYCKGMTGSQSRIITIANPVWGVSNVGTASVGTAFPSELRSGNQILITETVTTLNTGQTVDFTFQRPHDSRVRVSTFLNRIGCFMSPTFGPFFEDPPFTVVVNTNGAVPEAAANQANNRRNY
jgi:hypothetical protein